DAQHAALQARNGLHERQRLARAGMAAKARGGGLWLSKRVGNGRKVWATATRRAACCSGPRDPDSETRSCSRTQIQTWLDSLSGSCASFSRSAANAFGSLAISSPTMGLASERSRTFG